MSVLVRHAFSIALLFWEAGTHVLARANPDSSRAFRRGKEITIDSPCSTLSFSDNALEPYCMCRNVDLLSIDYALRPRLRCRLTPGGRTCPGKPWDSGDQNFHLVFRYSCPHNRSCEVHRRFPVRLQPVARRSPTIVQRTIREFGSVFDSRSFSARGLSSSQLLRTV